MVSAGMEAKLAQQIAADPQIPVANPTISLWQQPQNTDVGSRQSSEVPTVVDFAVIGSGIAACGVTKSLLSNPKSASKTIAVFEARGLCSGATGRNGGQLTRLPPTRHTLMAKYFGMEQANKILRLTLRTLQEVFDLAENQDQELKEACNITRTEKFFAYFDEQSWLETLEALKLYEAQLPEERGVFRLISKEEVASKYNLKGAYGGLALPARVCSPYRLVTGTFKRLLDAYPSRLSIETHTPIVKIQYEPRDNEKYPYILTSSRGSTRCATVIHCTNGHTSHLLPRLRGRIYPRLATMSVQSPGSRFPDQSTKQSWSFYFTPKYDEKTGAIETGRYYAQQNRDTGDIWVGGDQDSITGIISTDDSKIDRLAEENIRNILPRLFSKEWISGETQVKGVFTGVMAYTGDQVPFVGRMTEGLTGRQGSGEWIAAGWNTYGMANGLLCGQAVGQMILGEDISDWFPEPYLVSEKRLSGEKFQPKAVLNDWLERTGVRMSKL